MRTIIIFPLVFVLLSILAHHALAEEEQCRVSESGEKICEATESGGSGCVDQHENCNFWAEHGECDANSNYMKRNCALACGVCGGGGGGSSNNGAEANTQPARQAPPEPTSADREQIMELVKEYGEPQVAEGREASATLLVIRQTISYMRNFILREKPTHTLSENTIQKCTNRHDKCAFWSAIGECENNTAWMATNCAPSCRSCHFIDFATRCPPIDANARPGLDAGGLNRMFENIVATAPGNRSVEERDTDSDMPPYTVTVHSRPWTVDEAETVTDESSDEKYGGPPWVVTFDSLITDEECQHLIELGYKAEYKRSEDVGAAKFDGSFSGTKSERRTSENAWCTDKIGCRGDAIAQRIMARIESITGVASSNYEDFQILRYEEGQFYRAHHDYILHQKDRQCGPRILTFFLYLSDVEAGGGTSFPNLGPLTIMPKRGRAVLWPSVRNDDPMSIDSRTRHEALPVEKGTKFAANAWIHQHDYVAAHRKGCT